MVDRVGGKMSSESKVSYVESSLYRVRHSAAHVMAQAVIEMFFVLEWHIEADHS